MARRGFLWSLLAIVLAPLERERDAGLRRFTIVALDDRNRILAQAEVRGREKPFRTPDGRTLTSLEVCAEDVPRIAGFPKHRHRVDWKALS